MRTRVTTRRTCAGGRRRRIAAMAAALLIYMSSAPAWAMQVLDAVDHAELEAEISASAVSRIALAGDRIARVVRGPDGFQAEHDPESGDLYLRPLSVPRDTGAASAPAGPPATLFIGTEKGFTYRLALTAADRGAAQILIRNPDALAAGAVPSAADPRIGALTGLIRAVANREPLAGFRVETGGGRSLGGLPVIETWRGPRFAAHVLDAGGDARDAAALAGTIGVNAAAVWLAAAGTGPSGGRLAVVVRERIPDRSPGRAGDKP